ncbi:MAG: hypothetical protein ABIA83_01240 [Patescibacteria group bacterium]
MKIKRNIIISGLILVIMFAFVALAFFWIEETIPQDSIDNNESISKEKEEPDRQLYLTVMTHMEYNFNDDKNETLFLNHVSELRYAMDLADAVGAKLNIESEQPFAIANTVWNLNIMKEILDRGHGVQTHCDLGSKYTAVAMSPIKYSSAFKENKNLVDVLVGAQNNLGCSGGAGINDWVLAASIAGFKYINASVAGHLLAMPYENRPGEIWTDEYLNGEGWHTEFPVDFADSIYPLPFADATDFLPDPDPVIIVMPGSTGRLDNTYEGTDDACAKHQNCEFTIEDIDATIDLIKEASDVYNPELGVAKITVYIPVVLYENSNQDLLVTFFDEIGKLEDQGLIKFGTHKEVYEAYIEQTGFEL